MDSKSLCFSGHRTEKLPFDIDKLKQYIKLECLKSIEQGYDTFYHGACYGFDLICADVVLDLKKQYQTLKLIAVVPFIGQEKSWKTDLKNEYKRIIDSSDVVVILNQEYKRGVYHERNRYMVEKSNKIISYCDEKFGGTKYTLDYASRNGLELVNLVSYYL